MAGRFALSIVPYVALVPVLRQVPSPASGFQAMPWTQAVLISALLAALFGLHSWCYARWHPAATVRVERNEGLARLWILLFGLLVVGGHAETWPWFVVGGGAWMAFSLLVQRTMTRRHGAYRAVPQFGLWGLFILGQSLIALWVLRAGGIGA